MIDNESDKLNTDDAEQAANASTGPAAGTEPGKRRRRKRRVPDTSVPSPCVAICEYNDEALCKGCLRNPDEIRDWIIMDREQKLAVLDAIAERRKHVKPES